MDYLWIGFAVLSLFLLTKIILIYHAFKHASKQMDEIEERPQCNRQLKTVSTNHKLEELFQRINLIYQARQQERIVYQRRETQIRREIENISHDLRTPLTSIIGYVELLKEEDISPEDRDDYLQIISKRAKLLQGFIQDFYEIARMEGEDYPFLLEVINVQNTVSEAAVAYYHEFESKHIKVDIQLEERSSVVIADKIQFNRILNNLIQNALKFAEKQFIIKQYTIEGKSCLKFMNDRNQMSQEELHRIFDRFYTGDQTRSQGSSGLGLTITKLLVEKMKGSIEARFEDELFVIELKWPERM